MNSAITIHFAQHQELFEQQLESWKKANDGVMDAAKDVNHLTALVGFSLFIFDQIIGQVAQDRPTTVTDAKTLCDWYVWWYEKNSELIAKVEQVDSPIKGANKLRKTHRKVSNQFHTIRYLRSSITDFENGKGRMLDDVIAELNGN